MSSNYSELPPYAQISKKILELYCKYHKYKFHYIKHDNNSISPYWLRVYDFINLTNIYPENTHIIYFDLDVAITPDMFNIPIANLINDIDIKTNHNWDMYISVDHFNFTSINTGVIYIKNTPWIKQFLNKWIDLYPAHKWKFDDKLGKWQCNENILFSCTWAGNSYEQGSLKSLYQNNTMKCKHKILPVNTNIFGDNTFNTPSFTIHLMQETNDKREKIFSNFYKQLIVKQFI